ncbi:MAG: response regulator [Patescibacteria group bacterium]
MHEFTLTNKTIYLAEDDTFLASVIIQKLEMQGVIVAHFVNGEECLASIEKTLPDLLLLDIHLPGLTGYQILDVLASKQITPQLPVIVISNSGQSIEIERIQKLGIRDYIIKANFAPDEVIAKIVEALSTTTNNLT